MELVRGRPSRCHDTRGVSYVLSTPAQGKSGRGCVEERARSVGGRIDENFKLSVITNMGS